MKIVCKWLYLLGLRKQIFYLFRQENIGVKRVLSSSEVAKLGRCEVGLLLLLSLKIALNS